MVDQVNGSSARYQDAELDRWAGQEGTSTDVAANALRHAAGIESKVHLGADDATIRETIEEQERLFSAKGAAQGGGAGAELVALGFEEAWVGGALSAVAAVADVAILGKEIIDAEERGNAVERDATRAAMLANLDLPQSYKDGVMARLDSKHVDGWNSGAMKMGVAGRSTPEGRQAMALAQIHADQGANAAVLMINAGVDRATLAKTHPQVAQRYVTDPAFRMGFDAMQQAHQTNRVEYDQAVAGLLQRDARYQAHHVQVWI